MFLGMLQLGCDFFERRGEKRIDVRRFLGYVCHIAKACISDGSLCSSKSAFFLFLCAYTHIDIKSDYKFYTFICFTSVCARHIDIKCIDV